MIPGILWSLGCLLLLAVLVLLFPSPVARFLSWKRIPSPMPLPPDVTLRAFPRWLLWIMELVGGGIGATTFGSTIYIDVRTWYLTTEYNRRLLLQHELVHVDQWRRLGVWYLPRYIVLGLRYGRENHPMEVEARGGE